MKKCYKNKDYNYYISILEIAHLLSDASASGGPPEIRILKKVSLNGIIPLKEALQ